MPKVRIKEVGKTRCAPPVGRYFAFTIDPHATVDLYCDGVDEEALAAIKKLSFKTYVGFCAELPGNYASPRREFNRLTVRPLQQGPTRINRRTFFEPQMCVPIYPETSHPLLRRPLIPSKGFPWPNCYQPTPHSFNLRVRPQFRDYSPAIKLFQSDLDHFYTKVAEDNKRLKAISGSYKCGFPAPPLVYPEPDTPKSWLTFETTEDEEFLSDDDDDDDGDDAETITWCSNLTDSTPADDSESDSASSCSSKASAHPFIYESSPSDDIMLTPVVNIEIEFDNIPELPDFRDLHHEYKALIQIIQGSLIRSKEASDRFAQENPMFSNPQIVVRSTCSRILPLEVPKLRETMQWLSRSLASFTRKAVAYTRRKTVSIW